MKHQAKTLRYETSFKLGVVASFATMILFAVIISLMAGTSIAFNAGGLIAVCTLCTFPVYFCAVAFVCSLHARKTQTQLSLCVRHSFHFCKRLINLNKILC